MSICKWERWYRDYIRNLHLPRKILTQFTQIWKEWQIQVIKDKEKNLSEMMGMLCCKTSQFYAKHKTFFPYTVLLNLIKRPTPQKSENMDIMYHIHVHSNLKLNSMQTVMLFAKVFKPSSHKTHKTKRYLWRVQK